MRNAQQGIRGSKRVLRDRALKSGLDRQEPALRHRRRKRLARIGVVSCERRGLFFRRGATVAEAAPDVELQRCVEPDPVQPSAPARFAAGKPATPTDGHSAPLATFTYPAAASTRAAATCKSALYANASVTSADNAGSLNDASHWSATGAGAPPLAVHAPGTVVCGSACFCSSSVVGGDLSTQPVNAAAKATVTTFGRWIERASVQLQHEVIGDRSRRAGSPCA